MNERIEHNKKKYGDEIKSLESIISSDVRSSIPPSQFTSDMLVALKKQNKLNFLESIKKQANHKLTLSKKQMDFVTKIYNQCKKNIEKNENKS